MAYGAVVALDRFSMAVPAGSVVRLTGANGAGKTSLLRALAGLLAFSGGRVVAGTVEAAPPVAYVLEGGRVFRDLTVDENLRAGAFRGRVDVAPAYARFPVLAERRAVRAGLLSGGERQLLAVVRALVARPQTLLLDEPSVGLSAEWRELLDELVAEAAAGGATVAVAEQQPALALPGAVELVLAS